VSTLYVNGASSRADDANPGTSATNPLRTLTQANNLVASGDTVLVYPALYLEQVTPIVDSTIWRAVAPGAVVDCSATIHQPWVVHSGTVYKCTFGGATLQNLYVNGDLYSFPVTTVAGIARAYESLTHITESAFFHDTTTQTLYLDLGGPDPNLQLIQYGARPSPFRLLSRSGITVDGFTCQRSSAWGIRIDGGASNILRNNVCWQNPGGGIRVEGSRAGLFKPTVEAGTSTLSAGTLTYQVTAIVGGVETVPSTYQQITITAGQVVGLAWQSVVGATVYKIYGRSALGPPTQPNGTLLATVTSSANFPTYIDDGSATPDGTTHPPLTTTVKSYSNLIEDNECWQNGSHAINLFNSSSNTVRGNHCHHNALSGVSMQYDASDNVVELNRCWLNSKVSARSACGVSADFFGAGTPGSPRNVIQRNRCFRNQDSGIQVYNRSDDCIVRYNLTYLNGDHGVDNFSALRCHMLGNTAFGNVTAGLNSEGGGSGGGTASLGIRMYNNLALDNGINSPRTSGNYRIDNFTAPDSEFDYNLTYLSTPAASQPGPGTNAEIVYGLINYQTYAAFRTANPTVMVHGVNAQPIFADDDYRLMVGSPGIAAGTASAPDYAAPDYHGRSPAATPNMGAHHEYLVIAAPATGLPPAPPIVVLGDPADEGDAAPGGSVSVPSTSDIIWLPMFQVFP
jgi:parallel beta-helix repeat protein